MFDAKKLLDQFVGSGVAGGMAGGVAGTLLTQAVTGKSGKKLAGSALKVGGLALVGGLAYKAWTRYQQSTAPSASPVAAEAFLPAASDTASTQALSQLIVRAMIAAAKADGQIDLNESQAIVERIDALGLSADDRAFLFEEYARPLDIEGVAAAVDTPEHAAEVYAASLIMLDPPSPPEQVYLDSLARRLGLEPGLTAQIADALRAQQATAAA